MSEEHIFIDRLLKYAKAVEGKPPHFTTALHVSASEISMLAKGLELLAAVRAAAKR